MTPVWLLDIDGVINAISRKPNTSVWPRAEWRHGTAVAGGQEWPILWAKPVVDFITGIHESGRAEIRWHTSWQHEAVNLAKLVGLPEFTIAEAPEHGEGSQNAASAIIAGRPQWWKLPAAERVVRDERRPLVWTDDDLHSELRRYDMHGRMRVHAPVLAIPPRQREGLTPFHLELIEHFLKGE